MNADPRDATAALLLIVVMTLVGCAPNRYAVETSDARQREDVYLKGTPEYDRKVATMRLSPEEAAERGRQWVASRRGAEDGAAYLGRHDLIADGCYVFSPPDKQGYPLYGYYVDGNTEAVETRQGGRVPAKEIRRLSGRP